jgi:hypothetical protein
VYHIWRARNEIKFQGHPKTEDQMLHLIFWEVRNRISGGGKFIKNGENMASCRLWNIDEVILVRYQCVSSCSQRLLSVLLVCLVCLDLCL